MIVRTPFQRLHDKSYPQCLALRLARDYDLSPVEATTLSDELIRERSQDSPSFLADCQLWYTAVSKEEPAGKPLCQCQKVRVRLTLSSPSDLSITEPEKRRQFLVHRLSWEAYEQGALLTVEDLARLLITSERTVSRILASYAKQDIFIPTRGRVRDIGPGISHKAQAVHLYLKGFTPTEIATRLGHHLSSVERYLDDFCLVMMGLAEGTKPRTLLPQRVARLCQQAYQQRGLLTVTDLSLILGASSSTVRHAMQSWEEAQGQLLPTRSTVHDLGPTISHKRQIVSLHLQGYFPSEIARMTSHDPHNVDRYLRDFERVYGMARDGASLNKICFLTGLSPRLVKEYLRIIQEQGLATAPDLVLATALGRGDEAHGST